MLSSIYVNTYQYASNSPVALIDIDGLEGGWSMNSDAEQKKRQGEALLKQLEKQNMAPVVQLKALNSRPPFSNPTVGPNRQAHIDKDYKAARQQQDQRNIKIANFMNSDSFVPQRRNSNVIGIDT